MEASLRMGINTCNGINDMPDTDDVSTLSDTISKRRQQVEIRPQGAQTLACHFPSASYIDDGRNRQKDNGLRNHRATPIRSPLQRLGLCCLHRFDGQQMQKIPMDSAVLSSACSTFVCWPAEFLSHVPKSPSQRSKESTILQLSRHQFSFGLGKIFRDNEIRGYRNYD